MRQQASLIDRDALNPFFAYLLFCGIALLLSTPAATRVKNFEALSLLSGIPVFFYVYVLFSGLLGLNLGAIGAARGEIGRIGLYRLVKRVLLGHALGLPYVVFERALYPGREGILLLLFFYALVIGLLCGFLSLLLEAISAGGSHPFFLKYAGFIAYLAIPWGVQPILSPLGMVDLLFRGTHAGNVLLGFGVALMLCCGLFILLLRRAWRNHG